MPFDQSIQFTQPVAAQTAAAAPLLLSQLGLINAPTTSAVVDVTSFNSYTLVCWDNQASSGPPLAGNLAPGSGLIRIAFFSDAAGTNFLGSVWAEINSTNQFGGGGQTILRGPMLGPFAQVQTLSGNVLGGSHTQVTFQLFGSQVYLPKAVMSQESPQDGNWGLGTDGKLVNASGTFAPATTTQYACAGGSGPGSLMFDFAVTDSSTSRRITLRTPLNTGSAGTNNTIFTWDITNAQPNASWGPFNIILPKRCLVLVIQNLDATAGHNVIGTFNLTCDVST